MTVLGKDEEIVKSNQFTTNLLLAWLKTDFTLTSKRIVGFKPNTLLGLFPLGKEEVTFPLKNIASVSVSTSFYLKRFIIGFFLALTGLSMFGSSFLGGLIFLLLGALPLLNSYTAVIAIVNSGGQRTAIEMSIIEKDSAQQFVSQVNTTIADN